MSSRFDRKGRIQITSSLPPRLRVLTLAAYPTITYGLRAAVESDDALSYAGNISEWGALPERLADGDVQVVLADIDWSEDDLAGVGGLADLPPALLLAEDPDAGYAALAAGFRGVLLRESDVDEILQAIKTLALGLAVVETRILPPLLSPGTRQGSNSSDVEPLSPRETEVLDLIARGLPNKAIALELGISEHTVKFHVGSVLSKFGAASRSEAVAIAMRHGLVKV